MARTNVPVHRPTAEHIEQGVASHPDATTNHEGGIAYCVSPKMELYLRAAATLCGEPKFYDPSGAEERGALQDLVAKVVQEDPEFVLRLATYCRNDLYLRSVSQVLLVEAAAHPEARGFVRQYTPGIVRRADELAEVVALYQKRNGHIGDSAPKGMLAASLKKGLADTLPNFNEYQLAKYDRANAVKLRDVLRLVHPKPKNAAQAALWKRVLDRTLATPDTWEVALSTKGASRETWEAILPKMGIMAVLRNLRNLLDHDVDITPVVRMLEDARVILNSKQFPYRFYAAYLAIGGHTNPHVGMLRDALETAMDLSIGNVPHLPGLTLIATDLSASMDDAMSEHSKMSRAMVGCVLSAMAHKFCDTAIVGGFGDRFDTYTVSRANGTLNNAERLRGLEVGHSTNTWTVIEYMLANTRYRVDRLILFSDCQSYNDGGRSDDTVPEKVALYRQRVNPRLKVYSVDLAGYGTAQFPQDDRGTVLLSGWSDKVLSFLASYEEGERAIEVIEGLKPHMPRNRDEDAGGDEP